jgi:IS30 family transposase
MLECKQITIEEREKIYQFLKTDISLIKIASHLGRHKSTISTDISRNQSEKLVYLEKMALLNKYR